jgi:LysR family glycine cleavage system transcriptional activator
MTGRADRQISLRPQRLPDLESLRCFEAVADALNFRKAAGVVGLSPVSVGDRIRGLEARLGQPLFHRTTRTMSLTEAGHRLLPAARRILEEVQRWAESFDRSGDARSLSVGTSFERGVWWLTPALGTLRRSRPERVLRVFFGAPDDLLSRVLEGRLDCALTTDSTLPARVRQVHLHREDYALVARPHLVEGPGHCVSEIRDRVLLDLRRDLPLFRRLGDGASPRHHPTFTMFEYLGTMAAVRLRALEGAGIAVLPRYLIAGDLERGTLRQLLPEAKLKCEHVRLIWRAGHGSEADLTSIARELKEMGVPT